MKLLILLLFPLITSAQWKPTKRDITPALLSFAAGHIKGWHDEVTYHPNQLFQRFPNLNRRFWDIRVQDKPGFMNTEWDADHVLKGSQKLMFIAAICLKVGERKKWYWYLWDGVKYLTSYSIGFWSSYNLIHKNKL